MAISINLGEDSVKKIAYSKVLIFHEYDNSVSAEFLKYGGSDDKLLLEKGVEPPHLYPCYYSSNTTLSHSFAIEYTDDYLIDAFKWTLEKEPLNETAREVLKKFDRPASGIVITIDGRETISLNQNVRSENSNGHSTFPIGQDDFLKCCNASHLKFEIFKGGESINKLFDNEKDNILMIEHCRVLYNYVVNDSMFPDALPILLRWKKTGRIGKSTMVQRVENGDLVKKTKKTKNCVLIVIIIVLLLIMAL